MDHKRTTYEAMRAEIDEREAKLKVPLARTKTHAEIERLVFKFRDFQLSMLDDYHLTNQEKVVTSYILFGISYAHIKRLMVLELSTINFHVRNIFDKCHVNSRQDLCMLVLTKMYFAGDDGADQRGFAN